MSMGLATPALADVATTTTFLFSGQCSDCSGTVTGELVLANYTLGQAIGPSNFVSFHYDGSNLYNAFTVTNASSFSESGAMTSYSTTPADFVTYDANNYFSAHSDSTWSLGSSREADYGVGGTFTAADATTVPEPASLALLGAGMAGVAAVRRRRAA